MVVSRFADGDRLLSCLWIVRQPARVMLLRLAAAEDLTGGTSAEPASVLAISKSRHLRAASLRSGSNTLKKAFVWARSLLSYSATHDCTSSTVVIRQVLPAFRPQVPHVTHVAGDPRRDRRFWS